MADIGHMCTFCLPDRCFPFNDTEHERARANEALGVALSVAAMRAPRPFFEFAIANVRHDKNGNTHLNGNNMNLTAITIR